MKEILSYIIRTDTPSSLEYNGVRPYIKPGVPHAHKIIMLYICYDGTRYRKMMLLTLVFTFRES